MPFGHVLHRPFRVAGPASQPHLPPGTPGSTGQPGNAAASIGASKSRCSASDTMTESAFATPG